MEGRLSIVVAIVILEVVNTPVGPIMSIDLLMTERASSSSTSQSASRGVDTELEAS